MFIFGTNFKCYFLKDLDVETLVAFVLFSLHAKFLGKYHSRDSQRGRPYGALHYGAVSTTSKDALMSIPMTC